MGGEGRIGKSCSLSLPHRRYAYLPTIHAESLTVKRGLSQESTPVHISLPDPTLMMSREDDGPADNILGGVLPPPGLVKSDFLADLVRLAQFRRRSCPAFLQLTYLRKGLLLPF